MSAPLDVVAATQGTYAVIAQEYAKRWGTGNPDDWNVPEAQRLAGLLAPGARVADVGCGPGNHTVLLRELGLRAHGFDLSYEMLTARGVPGQAQADMRALPIADGALDAVWCAAALLHIPRELVPGTLAEFHRALRPGGHLVLSIAEGAGEGWEQVSYRQDERPRYFVYHSYEAITEALARTGFEVTGHGRRSTHRDWLVLHARRVQEYIRK